MFTHRQGSILAVIAASVLAACSTSTPSTAVPAHAVVGVQAKQLTPEYWIARDLNSPRVVLDVAAIAAQNARLQKVDPSVHDLEGMPATLAGADVRAWINKMSRPPDEDMFDGEGHKLERPLFDSLMKAAALDTVPASQRTRFGLVVQRADLRSFPSTQRGYDSADDHDIDRFQETALFPGTPVLIAHESRDGHWWFVMSPLYAAWVDKGSIAIGEKGAVFAYTKKSPYLVITGATAKTVYTPERPEVSQLQLDMGVRVPVLADWPASRPVNGQHPYTAHVIELPMRAADGSLAFTPALLPRIVDASSGFLPLTRANILRQGFKFLGERYGWGHSYNARDCSGFVSDVYRSFNVQLPRNTRDQAVTPAIDHIRFTDADDHEHRLAVLRKLEVGDLVYIPGHVMMVIGHENGTPYVIHDTTGISYRDAGGAVNRVVLNGVSVTPLTPLLFNRQTPFVDHITSILRVRP
jgi:cell wall-associated NlpC family hydrolase